MASGDVLTLLWTVTLSLMLGGRGTGQLVDLCTHLNITVPYSNLGANMTVLVSAASTQTVSSLGPDLNSIPPTANGVSYNNFYNAQNSSLTVADITVNKTLETLAPHRMFLRTVFVHNENSSWSAVYNVTITEQAGPGLQADLASLTPSIMDPNVSNNLRNTITWQQLIIPANESRTIQYEADVSGDKGGQLPQGKSYYTSTVTFSHMSSLPVYSFKLRVCLERFNIMEEKIFYRHGFTALSFFIALLLGILLVVLVLFLLLRYCPDRGCLSAVAPTLLDMKKFMKKGKSVLLYDAKAAMKKGFNPIKDFSMFLVDESIILILSLKDRLQMFREIDNLDILSTIHVDTDIEEEQNDMAVQTSLLLIESLRHNGDISAQMESKVTSEFRSRLQNLDRCLDTDYKKALQEVYKSLSIKNKERLSQLQERHKEETGEAEDKTRNCSQEETSALLKLVEQQHQTEENELTYILALEQKEEAEKLRKEFAVRKRMGIKEEQQHLLNHTCAEGHLVQQQADWLLKEHARQQEEIHRMYDEEISRQRIVLEEKLERRRALAHASEAQEDDHVEMLNTMAGHQLLAIQKMRKKDQMSPAQAEDYMQKVRREMLEVKDKMEREKERQEAEMHKKLSQLKKQRLAEKKKQQEEDVQEYLNRSKSQQTQGPADPVAFAEGLLKLKSLHRLQLNDLENDIDSEHFHELEEVRNQIAFSGRSELKDMEKNLLKTLQKDEGMSEKQVDKLLSEHDAELGDLLQRQQQAREKQKKKLLEDLQHRQQEWSQRKALEKREQEELREHEAKVVKKLINSQMSISEAERDRILKEHEKQMVQLENSLTLNKLRQKRMLEEKLLARRAQQLEKLQKKQEREVQKHRRAAENNGEESDEETQRQEAMLMKKYAERRIAVLQGSELNLEDEMAQIRQEMTKERALALKGQEERLGAMIAAMQLQKAREMAQIEEQQKAINNLKVNLMDDLTERGVLSNPECERIIQRHKEDQDQLNKKLDSQRRKQEKVIQQKLQARQQQRETSLLQKQDQEMQMMLKSSGSTTAAKIRRALLTHKQMLQLEEFRNQSEREVSQVLEEMQRQYDLIKQKQLQEQELEFIAGLVKVGGLKQHELGPVIQMLYPGKSYPQVQEVLDKIAERDLQTQGAGDNDSGVVNSLLERVRATQLASGLASRQGSLRSSHGSPKVNLGSTKKRMSQLSLVSSLNEESLPGERKKKKLKSKRGSFGAQRVNINGGFEPEGYPARPSSAMRGSISDNFAGAAISSGSYDRDEEDEFDMNATSHRPLGGYQHNAPIDEENYEYPRQEGFGDDFIGMGTGHQVLLPPIQTHHKGKKKKKLLKKLAHRNDEDDDE